MGNLPLAFIETMAGSIILLAGLSGQSVGGVMNGHVGDPSTWAPLLSGGGSSPSSPSSSPPSSTAAPSGVGAVGHVTPTDLSTAGAKFGWSGSSLGAWQQVITMESGGNPAALNPSSGAFGIGQFLGSTLTEYTKYGAASNKVSDQLNAMAQYIHDRYGSPEAALAHEQANHWY